MEKRGDVDPAYTPDLRPPSDADRRQIRLAGGRLKAAELAAQGVVARGSAAFVEKAKESRAD